MAAQLAAKDKAVDVVSVKLQHYTRVEKNRRQIGCSSLEGCHQSGRARSVVCSTCSAAVLSSRRFLLSVSGVVRDIRLGGKLRD